jgi:nitroreductase
MLFPAKEMIRKRKSVRSFDGAPLRAEDRAALEAFTQTLENPFGVPVEFRLLDAKEHGLSSPVVAGAKAYLAAKVRREGHFEIAWGYSFETACLYAASLGVGTVILAASLSRGAAERALEVQPGEVMPAASPLGYPAAKRTIRETLMRKGLRADERLAFEDLFFDGAFGTALPKAQAGDFREALELARWAPSATNKQPWRAVVIGDTVHFYEAQSMRESPLGDIQKVDVGIFLAHFDLAMREDGHEGRFLDADPGLAAPENVHYIISFEKTK